MTIFTKVGAAIASPVDDAGNPRRVANLDMQVWMTEVERAALARAVGAVTFGTKAEADLALTYDPWTTAWVLTGDEAGWYTKFGASGTGSWVRKGDLPYSYIKATNAGAGTANAIVATTATPIPAADGGALIVLPIVAATTASPVTVAFNGEAALTIKNNTGDDVAGLTAGMLLTGFKSGTEFRLTSDANSLVHMEGAQAWAQNPEDDPVEAEYGGDGSTTFSALHHAAKAEASATIAGGFASALLLAENTFATKATAEAWQPVAGPDYIRTAGYSAAGDGGGAPYKKVATQPSHEGKLSILLADGVTRVWYEITGSRLNILQFGAKDDGVTPAQDAINAALICAKAIGAEKVKSGPVSGTFVLTGALVMQDGVEFCGNRKATLKRADSAVSLLTLVDFGLTEKASMKDWIVDGNRAVVGDNYDCVDVRIGGAIEGIFNGNVVKNCPAYAVVVNTGRDIVINNNVIFNFGNAGIVAFPSGLGDRQVKEVCGNYIHRAGWGGIGIGSHRALVRGNVLEGVLIGGRGDRLTVNTSGTTVTRVSGPDFSEIVPGNWMTINGGMEFRIKSVDSPDQLTTDPLFNGAMPTLAGVQASVGSGDLMGVNGDDCIVTNNILEKAATFLFGIAGAGKRITFIGNKLKYAGKCAIVVHDGADTLEDNIFADNIITEPGYGGGIGTNDRIAIFVYGTVAGRVSNTQFTGNIVTSSAGEGQAEYWLGTNPTTMAPGSIVANGNQARGLVNDTISGDILSIELSAGWGDTATTPYIRSTGDTVHFDVRCSGTGFAGNPTFTVTKIVEKNGWKPVPDATMILAADGGTFGAITGQYLSGLGVWKGIVGITPGTGHIYSILVKD